jgi:hypothetical protein
MTQRVSDPATIQAIEDAYALVVYHAEYTYQRRLAGRSRPPRRPVQMPERLAAAVRRVA